MPMRGSKNDQLEEVPLETIGDIATVNGMPGATFNDAGTRGQTSSPPPDPVALSAYIEELFASLNNTGEQSQSTAMTIDPQAVLTSLNPNMTFASTSKSNVTIPSFEDFIQNGSASTGFAGNETFQFVGEGVFAGTSLSENQSLAFELENLPDQLQRGASILQTVNPSDLLSPSKAQDTYLGSADLQTVGSQYPQTSLNGHAQYTEYAPPVESDDWSTSDDNGGGEDHFGHGFFEHDFEPADTGYEPYGSTWPNPAGQQEGTEDSEEDEDADEDVTDDVAYPSYSAGNQDLQVIEDQDGHEPLLQAEQPAHYEAPTSSSDSDIPLEDLINPNTSRSVRSSPSAEEDTDAEDAAAVGSSSTHPVNIGASSQHGPSQQAPMATNGISAVRYNSWSHFRNSLPDPEVCSGGHCVLPLY